MERDLKGDTEIDLKSHSERKLIGREREIEKVECGKESLSCFIETFLSEALRNKREQLYFYWVIHAPKYF